MFYWQIVGNKLKRFGIFFGRNVFGKPHATVKNKLFLKLTKTCLEPYRGCPHMVKDGRILVSCILNKKVVLCEHL